LEKWQVISLKQYLLDYWLGSITLTGIKGYEYDLRVPKLLFGLGLL
jgi:hypothetical protein